MQYNRTNIIILFFSLTVAMMGFGIVIPILPFYIESLSASGSTLGLLMAAFAVMQFVFAPVWGGLADRHGRKPVLLLGVVFSALAHLAFGLSTELWMLFISRIAAGIFSSAIMTAAMAFMADSTSTDERSSGMGIVRSGLGVGLVLGPGIGGFCASISLSLPFYCAAGLSALAVIPICLALPESLPEKQRSRQNKHAAQSPRLTCLEALSSPIGSLLVLGFLVSFALTAFESIIALYSFKLYGYGPVRIGSIFVFIGVISAIMQGTMTGPLCRRLGETAVIQISLVLCPVGFILMLRAVNFSEVLFAVGFFIFCSALLRPAVASLISQRTAVTQGKAMGLNNSVMSLGRIVGPVCAGMLFDINTSYPYLIGSAVMLVGLFGSFLWLEDAPLTVKTNCSSSKESGQI